MLIYKIADRAAWDAARAEGFYRGSADDVRDGYIHFSAASEVGATAARHFAGRDDLIIAAVDASQFDAELKWEASRGGALFPHLYGPLPMAAVQWWRPLPLGDDGVHALPQEVV